MKLNKKYLYWLILLFLVVSTTSSTAKTTYDTEEWKVKVGDSRTYTLSKYFDIRDVDGNGDPESKIYSVTKEDGTKENITWKKGTKYTINITALGDHSATFQLIFGNITSNKRTSGIGGGHIRKTIDNKSYWEFKTIIDSYPFVGENVNYTVEGNNYVKKLLRYTNYGVKYELISKRNWKTGWLTYSYEKTTNDTHTKWEEEITSGSSSIGITSIEITTIFVGLTIIAIVVSRKRQQTK